MASQVGKFNQCKLRALPISYVSHFTILSLITTQKQKTNTTKAIQILADGIQHYSSSNNKYLEFGDQKKFLISKEPNNDSTQHRFDRHFTNNNQIHHQNIHMVRSDIQSNTIYMRYTQSYTQKYAVHFHTVTFTVHLYAND